MNDKQINRWLRRQFAPVGWVMIAYYVLLNFLVSLSMGLDAAKQELWAFAAGDRSGVDMSAVLGNAWGYIVTIAVGLVILHGWKGPDLWREILVKEKPIRPGVVLALVSLCIGTQMVNSLWVSLLELVLNQFGGSVMPLLDSVSGDSDTFSMFLYASILAPIAEEILFRGYVLRKLRPYGKRFAIWGSAILFGLFHGNLLQTPYAVLMGLLLGYVTVEYSLGWAVFLHMFNNLILADLLTRLTAGWSDMAYGILNMVLFGGFFLISLVLLIKNRYAVRAYRKSEWMDRRCLKCFFTNPGVLIFTAMMAGSMISLLFV